MSAALPIRIFIADDHRILRDGLTQLLGLQPDFEVVGSAGEGREALRAVSRLRPHVVILDIDMPGLNGIDATRELLAAVPTCAVLILSMHASAEHVLGALEAGAQAYLQKDAAAAEVVEAVRATHAGERYLGPRIGATLADYVRGSGIATGPLESLSRREREVLQLVAQGHTSASVAARLHLSPKTVDTYRSRLKRKLELADGTGLVKFALRHRLITLD